jgi:hypothetical protein
MNLASFWAIFSQTHPVTLPARHPSLIVEIANFIGYVQRKWANLQNTRKKDFRLLTE